MEKYKLKVAQKGLEEVFVFHGGVFGKDRKTFYEKASLYITPSLSEVISLSAIEAMAYGLPCVLTRQSDVSYFYNMDFFEMCENYPQDIARALKNMLDREIEWESMSVRSRLCYENNFKWDANILKFIEAYELYSNQAEGK